MEGVAWRAGLRTGDFLIEVRLGLPSPGGLTGPPPRPWPSQVNGVNVVKVGHKQVVALIRQGGNRLVMKVVSVTRKPEEDGARRRGECWVPLLSPDLRPLTLGPRSSSRCSLDC